MPSFYIMDKIKKDIRKLVYTNKQMNTKELRKIILKIIYEKYHLNPHCYSTRYYINKYITLCLINKNDLIQEYIFKNYIA